MSWHREDLDRLVSELVKTRVAEQLRIDVGLPFLREMLEGIVNFEVDTDHTGKYIIVARVDISLEDLIRQLGERPPVQIRGLNVTAMMAFCLGALIHNQEGH